jgi:hypothetical protein
MRPHSWVAMRHDQEDIAQAFSPEGPCKEDLWWDICHWMTYYWWPTRRWMPKVSLWWGHHVRRFPQPPPFNEDPVARHFGFVEGVPACQGPICVEHEWKVL